MELFDNLQKLFKNKTKKEILESWEETKHFDKEGLTVCRVLQRDYFCKCNNCDNILYDENPPTGSEKMFNQQFEQDPLKMVYIDDCGDIDCSICGFWVCPVCFTDDYLTDL